MNKEHKTSFSWELKKEVINNLSKPHEIKRFLSGLLFCAAEVEKDFYVLKIKNEYLYSKLLRKLEKINIKPIINLKWKTKILIKIPDLEMIEEIDFKDSLTSFFAGVFFGSGSISGKSSTSYHLEISSHNPGHLVKIQEKLNQYDFNFNFLNRNNKYIIYLKNKEKVIDFLAAIDAKKSWYKLQNIIIARDFENVVNRINNIDMSNINKIAKSTIKHIENINYMFENGLDIYFTDNQLVLFRLKVENKWLSLPELSNLLNAEHNMYVSKSGINHWFRKLNEIVTEHKNTKK
ncbi:DNA-binding protein WhiA [Mycoplasma sp. 2248]|uniref:DNA-binding protein WhiA n=1 Tax=Mycoplasma sp. 2248 TaxID=3108528 RepID=UPI002B1DC8BF|nr:DNA-binding protein WhiA [Mycoplasma sp. 2248]MEA4191123.1 DNA-binding protein WhiA [Mycoplasma sp. 2248]